MAILQKIRERSGLLIGVIGFCILAFVAGDLLSGGLNLASRNIGTVNGKAIPTQDFLVKIQNAQQRGQNSSQVYNQIWNTEVRNILLSEQFEKIGLRLGKDQLINVIKTLPDFQTPQFQNELGQFDVLKFNQFLSTMQQGEIQQWNAWLNYEKQIEHFAKEQVYYAMVKGAVNTTSLEAKFAYSNDVSRVSFDYVSLPFSSIKDEEVKVTNEEILAYMKKHEKQFKSEPTRAIDYVFIENKPSEEDQQTTKQLVADLLEKRVAFNSQTNSNDTLAGFRNTNNLADFVNQNSDVPFDSTYYPKDQLPTEHSEALYNLTAGDVYGPYLFNDFYCVSRLVSKKNYTDNVTASHILIAHNETQQPDPNITLSKAEAKAKAEDLLKQLQANPSLFASLAEQNTDDPGSKSTGGQYKNIQKGQMVPEFDEFIFNKPTGSLGIVETTFGYHVIKVDSKEEKEGVQLATIAKRIEISSETQDKVHSLATKFEESIDSKDFSALATELGLISHPTATVKAFDENLPAVGTQREAIRWAFSKGIKANEYKRFTTADGELIVKVKEINDTGLMGIEQAKAMVEPILVNNKKAELLRKKMSGSTLEEIAKAANTSIQKATEITLSNPSIASVQEPKVVGAAYGRNVNEVSPLIDGRNGVYIVKTVSKYEAPKLPSYDNYKNRVSTNNRNTVNNSVFSALYQKADIEDNRSSILN